MINPVNFNRIVRNAQVRAASTFGAQTTRTSKDIKGKQEDAFEVKDQYTIQEQYQDAMENAQHTGAVGEQLKRKELEDDKGDYARHAFYPEGAETDLVPTPTGRMGEENLDEPEVIADKVASSLDKHLEIVDKEVPEEIRQMAEQMVLQKIDEPNGVEEIEQMTRTPEVEREIATIESDIIAPEKPASHEISDKKLIADNMQPMPELMEEQDVNLDDVFMKMSQEVDYNVVGYNSGGTGSGAEVKEESLAAGVTSPWLENDTEEVAEEENPDAIKEASSSGNVE